MNNIQTIIYKTIRCISSHILYQMLLHLGKHLKNNKQKKHEFLFIQNDRMTKYIPRPKVKKSSSLS